MRSSRCSESSSLSAAVGSSRMSAALGQRLGDRRAAACPRRCRGSCRLSSSPTYGRELRGLGVRLVPVDDPAAGLLVAEEDVLGDRQVRRARLWWMMTMPSARCGCCGTRPPASRDLPRSSRAGRLSTFAGSTCRRRSPQIACTHRGALGLTSLSGAGERLVMRTSQDVVVVHGSSLLREGSVRTPARLAHRRAVLRPPVPVTLAITAPGPRRVGTDPRGSPRPCRHDDGRVEQVARDDLHAVVVGLGVVDLDLPARSELGDHRRDAVAELTGVLPHRHRLLAREDVEDVRLVGILAGQDRPVLARGVARGVERLGDAERERVVRRARRRQLSPPA